ncbi:MAG TPA: hypothetical protein PLS76_03665 [Acinetobacter sp.]|nr:hypothetical protein [Acinetobacter sp.]
MLIFVIRAYEEYIPQGLALGQSVALFFLAIRAYEEYIPQGLAQLKSFALFFLFTHSIAVRLAQLKSSAFLNAAHVDNFVNNPVDNRVDKREDKLLLK